MEPSKLATEDGLTTKRYKLIDRPLPQLPHIRITTASSPPQYAYPWGERVGRPVDGVPWELKSQQGELTSFTKC